MQEEEIWKDIPGYEGYYQVSNLGRVKSLDRIVPHPRYKCGQFWKGRISTIKIDRYGYPCITLNKKSHIKTITIHRLVAKSFISNPENKPQVNHIDGNKLNNKVNNLEWCTSKQNTIHAWKTGLCKSRLGSNSSLSKVVLQYDLDMNLLNKYNGSCEASRITGINRSSISAVCNGRGVTAGGYIWKHQ